MKLKITEVFIVILLVMLSSCEKNLENDTSYSEEKYYELGLAKSPYSVDDYSNVYDVFNKIAQNDKNGLPRYNSKRSRRIFNNLFNEAILRQIVESAVSDQQKTTQLEKFEMIFDRFFGLYSMNSEEYKYWNESSRISSLITYSRILSYKITDDYLSKNGLTLNDVSENPESFRLNMVKMIGKGLWGLDVKVNKFKKADD